MSYYLHTKSIIDSLTFVNGEATVPVTGEPAQQRIAADHALDSALRNLPLPDGMMARLEKLARALPDESADQVDWLSC
jgi:hypothetical protein